MVVAAVEDGGLVAQITADLEAAGRLWSVAGQQAVLLAHRLIMFDTGSGAAALSKELSRVMGEALEGAAVAVDPVDELRSRRDLKRDAG